MVIESSPEEYKVFRSLANPKWSFRTVHGICQETGLSEHDVREAIRKMGHLVTVLPGRDGRDLFTWSSRIKKPGEFFLFAGLFLASLILLGSVAKKGRRS